MNSARLNAPGYNNTDCSLEAHSNGGPGGVSYERRVTAAFDECKLENSRTDSNIIRWDDIFNKENICWSSSKWIYPEGNVLVIGNNEGSTVAQQKGMYGPAIRGDDFSKVSEAEVMQNRNLLALYIFGFLFPGKAIAEGMGITYDAGGGDVTKIFSGIPTVTAIITPQNISDSASTMLNPFNSIAGSADRSEFIFPTDFDDPVTGIKEYTFKSQIYSKEWCTIKIKNKDYSKTNKNGFIIEFSRNDQVGVIATINYDDSFELLRENPLSSAKSMQGPSAPYLSKVIEFILSPIAGHDPKNITVRPMKPIIMPVKKLVKDIYNSLTTQGPNQDDDDDAKNKISGLLFDLKRAGDYEQANAAKWLRKQSMNIILSTGDVLCSTYARKLEIPCILGGIGTNSGLGSHAIAVFRTKDDAEAPSDLEALTNYSAPTDAHGLAVLPFLNALTYIQQNKTTIESKAKQQGSAFFLRAKFYRLSCSGKLDQMDPAIFKPVQTRNSDVVEQFFELYTNLLKIKFYKLFNEMHRHLTLDTTAEDQHIQKVLEFVDRGNLLDIINDPEQKRAMLLKIRTERGDALETLRTELSLPTDDSINAVMHVYRQMMSCDESCYISNINTQFKKHDISLEDCEKFFDCKSDAIPMFSKKMLYEHVSATLRRNASSSGSSSSSSSSSTGQAVSVNHIKVNNFLVSIGLDIPLFYEVFKKYYDFLGGMAIKLKINKERIIKFNNKTKFNFSALSDQFPLSKTKFSALSDQFPQERKEMIVTIPEGSQPDSVFQETTPDGQIVSVQVPPGAIVGMQFHLQLTQTSPIEQIKKLDVGFNQYFTTVEGKLREGAATLITSQQCSWCDPQRVPVLLRYATTLDSGNINKVLSRFNDDEIKMLTTPFAKSVQTTLTDIQSKFDGFKIPPSLLLSQEQCLNKTTLLEEDVVKWRVENAEGAASAACQTITTWWRNMRGGSIQQKGGAQGDDLKRIAVLTIKNISANCDDFIIEQINNVVDQENNPIILYWFRLFSILFNLYETLNIYKYKIHTMVVDVVDVEDEGVSSMGSTSSLSHPEHLGYVREFASPAEDWKGKRESFRTLGISLISIQQQISILDIEFPNSCLHLLPDGHFLKSTVEVFKNVLQTRDLQTYVNLKDLPFHHHQDSARSYMKKWTKWKRKKFDTYDIQALLTELFTTIINGTETSLKDIFSEATTDFDGFMLPTASGNSSPDIMLDKMELKAPVVRSSKAFMEVMQTVWVDALLEAIDLEPNIKWEWGLDTEGDRICPTFTNPSYKKNFDTFSLMLFGQDSSKFIRRAAFLHNTFQLKSSAFNPFTFSLGETAEAQKQFNTEDNMEDDTEDNTIAVKDYFLNNFDKVFDTFQRFQIDVQPDLTFKPKTRYIVETLNGDGAFLKLPKETAGGGSKRGRTKRKKRKKRKTKKRRKKGKKTRKRKGKKKKTRRF